VFDCVGGDAERRAFERLRRGGRLISIAGPDPDLEVNLRNIALVGLPASLRVARHRAKGRRYRFISARVEHRSLVALAALVDKRVFDVRVDRSFPLEQLAEAQRISDLGAPRGKLVIDHRAS
jgi:NADPH:quinone reductase-like Zn-dependent oxidoreductase